mgnify:CR=1 FL=1
MTEIKLYNSKTRSKSIFSPLDPKNVRMYVCGPTVYDRAHIGNARPVIRASTRRLRSQQLPAIARTALLVSMGRMLENQMLPPPAKHVRLVGMAVVLVI